MKEVDDYPIEGQRHGKWKKPFAGGPEFPQIPGKKQAVGFGNNMIKMCPDRNQRDDHGGAFPDYKADHGEADGGSHTAS